MLFFPEYPDYCNLTGGFLSLSLKWSGCRTLETLRNSNIGQPHPSNVQEQDKEHRDQPYRQFQEDQDEPFEDDSD